MLDLMRLQIEANGGTWKETPAIDVSQHMVACLVEDQGQAMRFVTGEDLQTWGIPLYLAMETAIQNLEEDSPEMYLRVGESLYVFRTGDAYDATRMLALDLMHRLKVEGQLLALPLERDRLLVTGTEDEVGLMLMATFADDDEQNEGHPVCSVPHVLIGDEWKVWTPPKGHPTEEQFRVLALKSSGSEYLDQEALLQKWLEAKGSDEFVAGFGELEHKSDGRLRSWCAWSKGVPTWLPKTDLIAFYDPDTETRYMVEWNRAVEQFGSLMQPMECWPPRWKVEAFPDPLELEGLKLEGW
jgi:hypothetical protein